MSCIHNNKKTTMMPAGSMHYAREDCLDCGRFITWLPNPENVKRHEENERRKKILQGTPQTEWVKGFLSTLPKKLSPKQQAKLDELWNEQNA